MRKFITRLSLGPILKSMVQSKYVSFMLVCQIAITLAVTSNGLFIAYERYENLQQPSGLDESNIFVLTSSGFTKDFNPTTSIQTDLAMLRAMPNVVNAVKTNSFPFSNSGGFNKLQTSLASDENTIEAADYRLDAEGINTFGLSLIAGQNFTHSDVLWLDEADINFASQVILPKAVAYSLFNTRDWQSLVGKTIYINKNHPAVIVGIVEVLQAPWADWLHKENAFISPSVVTHNSARYVIRVKEGFLQTTIADVEQLLSKASNERIIRNIQTLKSMRKNVYGNDIAAMTILLIVVGMLIIIAALGITGLTSFNVVKRQEQIGIRRALGATKGDILRYFFIENTIQTSFGVVLGSTLAIALNIFLVEHYTLPKLQSTYLALAILVMYLLGILATLRPALKATKVSPSEATRSN